MDSQLHLQQMIGLLRKYRSPKKTLEKTLRRSESVSNEIPFHPVSEMKPTIKAIQDCLEQMRQCRELEFPFNVATEMESAIFLSEDCLNRMGYCCELCEKLARIESLKREGSSTRIMLLLMEYGSEDNFKAKIESAITTFSRRLEDLDASVKRIEMLLMEKSYKCPECKGTGEITKWDVIRERGSPPQSVIRSSPCDGCNGTGQVQISMEFQQTLTLFWGKANETLVTMSNFHRSFEDFTSTSYARMQTKKIEEPKKREPSQRQWEAKPEEKEGATVSVSVEEIAREKMLKPRVTTPSWPYPKEYFLNLLNLNRDTSHYSPAPGGTPTWWERRANRQYVCSICKNLIENGERYIGRKKLRPGMRGSFGFRGTYVTDYYHIVCLLKGAQADIKRKIRNSHSEISELKSEITSFKNQIRSKRQQVENCEARRQEVRKDYKDAGFWRKLDKWVRYRYTSSLKSDEISRLEREIAHIECREIPERETEITNLKERISTLSSNLSEIEKRTQELMFIKPHK